MRNISRTTVTLFATTLVFLAGCHQGPQDGVVDRLLARAPPTVTGFHGSTLPERRFSKTLRRLLRF